MSIDEAKDASKLIFTIILIISLMVVVMSVYYVVYSPSAKFMKHQQEVKDAVYIKQLNKLEAESVNGDNVPVANLPKIVEQFQHADVVYINVQVSGKNYIFSELPSTTLSSEYGLTLSPTVDTTYTGKSIDTYLECAKFLQKYSACRCKVSVSGGHDEATTITVAINPNKNISTRVVAH